jgi:hypothetical protein
LFPYQRLPPHGGFANYPFRLKMMRNLSMHEGPSKIRFLDHVDTLAELVVAAGTPEELLVEALGIIGNLTIDKFNYSQLLSE